MTLSAEWRTRSEGDTILIVEDSTTVRQTIEANAERLSRFLTDHTDLSGWKDSSVIGDNKLDPSSWGKLVIARAMSGEVITMDPELYWNGIHIWFRSRGVDYDSAKFPK